ncbi:C-type lectin domain family 17, member A-like [Clytia hemisphaerica]|uniref:C-type lectin domain-containing protein n=1 Tax=Clytia hemisphaerica TaxID=252671 RepID=A0A7M5XB05_9CNID
MLKLAFGLMLIAVCGASTIQLLRVRTTKTVYTSQYTIHRKAYNWLQARAECIRCGGHLVTINDVAEHFFLTRALQRYKIRSAWTGLNDRAKEGDYRWDRFNAVGGYKRWCKGEPNNLGNEDAAELFAHTSSCLNDLGIHHKRFFICEVNVHKTLSVKTV